MVKKTSLQVIPNERGKSFRIDLKSSRIRNEYRHSSIYAVNAGTHKKPQKEKTALIKVT